ncbi:MAG: hypothetical protein HXS52_07400 [Theionarchaea archaeon]|nr:hypothetical protein [Theionarchaea archaeon]MBU7037742.1 hypothetical protein [Theionarchaea archaeon]
MPLVSQYHLKEWQLRICMRQVVEVTEQPCTQKEGAIVRRITYSDGTTEVRVSGDCWGCDYFSVWMKCIKYEKRAHE